MSEHSQEIDYGRIIRRFNSRLWILFASRSRTTGTANRWHFYTENQQTTGLKDNSELRKHQI